MPKFVDVGVAKPSFSSAYILTFKLKPPSYAVPSNFIHCTLQGGDLLEHFQACSNARHNLVCQSI